MRKFWARILTPNILLILLFENSRKVGFGLWLFIVATILLLKGRLIDGDSWMLCAMASGAMITGGTMFDNYMKTKFGGTSVPAQPPAA
ncbi:MAG TPA: hypothetical protein VD994_03550 [Prosthecobacter sp.]|nr:hypothetical protein [Prosthecobacter sp.]